MLLVVLVCSYLRPRVRSLVQLSLGPEKLLEVIQSNAYMIILTLAHARLLLRVNYLRVPATTGRLRLHYRLPLPNAVHL